jgi:hypothetical protein
MAGFGDAVGKLNPLRPLRLRIINLNTRKHTHGTHEKLTPMFNISPTIALAVFVSAFALDFLYARYTYYIISMKAEMAATISFVWHMLSATVIVQYAENSAYIVFMCLGGTLGTYLTVWQRRRASQITNGVTPDKVTLG